MTQTPEITSWMASLKEQGMTRDSVHEDSEWEPLKRRLLAHAGDAVIYRHETDLKEILERGEFAIGNEAELRKGNPNRCHENAAVNFADFGDSIATGYALSTDGAWRQHSWNIDKETGRVIETTEMRVAYFGFVLDEAESQGFLEHNPPTPRVINGSDDDLERREFIIVAPSDTIRLARSHAGHTLEVTFAEDISEDSGMGPVWIIGRDPENRYLLQAWLQYPDVSGFDDAGSIGTILSAMDFEVFDPQPEITAPLLIARLDRASVGDISIEITDEGAESRALFNIAWPEE